MQKSILESLSKLFQYYKSLGEKVFTQLDDDELFSSPNSETNSIAIIVKHLSGNMISRWSDFLATDGEKEWRNRDSEFENDIRTRKEMLIKWHAGWNCLFAALKDSEEVDLASLVYIRDQGHTILESFHRQLAHYAYHIGQIVHVGKSFKGSDWKSLSIPRGQSKLYKEANFLTPKDREHFTDDFIGTHI